MSGFRTKQRLTEDACRLCKNGTLTDVHAQALYRHLIFRLWTAEDDELRNLYKGHVMPGCISNRHLSRNTGVHRNLVDGRMEMLEDLGLIRTYYEITKRNGKEVFRRTDVKLLLFDQSELLCTPVSIGYVHQ
jgi:hypothetical protein